MEVSVDQALCRGDCVCELICPQVFALDEGGIAHVVQDGVFLEGPTGWLKVPPGLEPMVLDAARECPTNAICVRQAEVGGSPG